MAILGKKFQDWVPEVDNQFDYVTLKSEENNTEGLIGQKKMKRVWSVIDQIGGVRIMLTADVIGQTQLKVKVSLHRD